jgi:hypothetical protein
VSPQGVRRNFIGGIPVRIGRFIHRGEQIVRDMQVVPGCHAALCFRVPHTRVDRSTRCLPGRSGRCTVRVVSPLDNIFEDLKALPPDRLEMAANYIRRLKPISEAERKAALARTFGCLSPEEADELERVIEEGCEQINAHGW